ncbi:M3 family metallopeptidase [Acetobacter oeni]|uniref:Dipeptidyl carboxypeptidase n=1 Tax=Acetobacter oeni TaxID=304077 RepID=A0A511XLG4_9PROT|nr:M3 family metallopeptidase [Acetobacter oeni]MBB3883589.1 peptidyl-dipeptidase Dcp [Acetobacter oeni]NHO19674.1 dipeptidyl carboxypeptidase II [Acetobacter oeni]GBR02784.1 peptidyl-dipeptidase DCP [Acetobacter oeni LMG 21952]GEN63793.1 dipeptidyl carboxypeptidase II [Acetobacter oeni]
MNTPRPAPRRNRLPGLSALSAVRQLAAPCALIASLGLTHATLAASPLASASPLPYQTPPFDRIHDADYQPAFEQGMAEQRAEVEKIATSAEQPTFENTIAALERSGRMLDRVNNTFSCVYSADTNPVLDKVQEAEAPKLSAHEDAIYLNPKLFSRVKALYNQRATSGLNTEQLQVLTLYYQAFIHAGAQLSDADKQKLRVLNEQLATLETTFQQKLLAGTKAGAFVTDNKSALAGFDNASLAAAAKAAEDRKLTGKWVIPLQNTTQQPGLASLTQRDTRHGLFEQSLTRTEKNDSNDTRGTIATIARLRAQKAALLGYPDYASYVLYDQMAKTPRAVHQFISQLVPATLAEQKREAGDIQSEIKAAGQNFTLAPWDWNFYADKIRSKRFNLDENAVKPYFELNTVLRDGVFYAATRLYGITFKERHDLPVWNPDVMVFEVFDKDGSPLGLAYFDYFKRDNKSGGAWMSNLVGQSKLLGTKPVIYNIANLPKPAKGQPALITFEDVTTMFHEFGHGLHGLFANQTYPMVSGTSVARDFVEFPSQFNEHWALDPEVLAHYARNVTTGAPMPAVLIDSIKRAARFNQGYALGEIIAAAELDMDWHTLPAGTPKQDVDRFEAQALAKTGLDTTDVPPRYRSSYFLHIWANGYASGYYAYLWTEMLDDDVFAWFRTHGGLTRENGQRFRDMILSQGHTQDYEPMFEAFYGKAPDITPMLQHRALLPGDN